MIIKTTTTLPDKPSALIKLALDDLRKAERDPRYEVWMGYWHTGTWHPQERTACCVCLAGAVMAGTLGAYPADAMFPESYDEETCGKLEALNYFRLGAVQTGLRCFYRRPEEDEHDQRIDELARVAPEHYLSGEDNTSWYLGMERLADELQQRGH